MSLITRCPRCGTMFKVVTDQLKVSSGWVRCGHCAEVFDATAHLQQVAAASPAVLPTNLLPEAATESAVDAQNESSSTSTAATAAVASEGPTGNLSDSIPDADDPSDVPSPALTLREPEIPWTPGASFADRANISMPGLTPAPKPSQAGPDDDGHSDFDPIGWRRKMLGMGTDEDSASADTVMAGDDQPASVAVSKGTTSPSGSDAAGAVSEWPADDSEMTPESQDISFVRDARRRAFWRKPAVRLAMGAGIVLLGVLLAFQVGLHQRDALVAMEPRLKPVLQAVCGQLGCELAPLKQIDAVIIDSSSFSKLAPDTYRLSFSLRNTGALTVAMPALEVTLTDTQEQPLVRRVVEPEAFGATTSTLPAGGSFSGYVALQVAAGNGSTNPSSVPESGRLRVAGYRVLAFYP